MKTKSLLDLFEDIPEPRKGNGIRHKLEEVLVIVVLTLLSDCRTYMDMEIFAKVREDWLRTFLTLPGGYPSHDTFGDILAALDANVLHQKFQEWTDTLREKLSGDIITIDGKMIRRSKDKANGKRPCM